MEMFQVVLGFFWLVAGCVSFYFSIGNARVWTSIAVGFFLIDCITITGDGLDEFRSARVFFYSLA